MQRIVSVRNYLLAACVIVVLTALPISNRLTFDQRLESLFAEDNADIQLLQSSRKAFGGNELLVVAWREDRLIQVDDSVAYETLPQILNDSQSRPRLTPAAQQRIQSVTEALNAVTGVNADRTQSLASMLKILPPGGRTIAVEYLKLLQGTFIGKDARTTAIAVELLPAEQVKQSRSRTLAKIESIATDLKKQLGADAQVAVAGEPLQVQQMFDMVEEDGSVLFLVSLAVLALVLAVLFRWLRWVLAPVGLVLAATTLTRTIMALSGAKLSMVSSILNSLVTVIGIATCMHVFVHYRSLRQADEDSSASTETGKTKRRQLAVLTLQSMAIPVFWTIVTTMVGFGSLLVSQINPVRSFASMMILATAMVFISCLLILPATLASGSRLRMPARIPFEGALDFALEKSRQLGAVFPQATVVVCLAMLAAATFGIQRLQLETDFSRNFRDDSKIVRSLQFVETNLGPAGTWEVCFDVPEEITDTVLNQVRELTISIRKAARPETTVLSISDLCYLPLFRSRPASTFRRMSKRRPKIAAAMHNQNQQRMRILLKSVEQQPSETKLAEIASVRKAVSDFFRANSATQTSGLQPTASGMFVLLAEVIQSLLRDQLASFVIACLGICLCISIAFRSITLGLIALLPNIFPVAVVMGFLGWQGVPVNIGTAMITSVSMGLTVDSTIHYLTAYRRARHNQTLDQALKIAHEEAGRAVVFAHIALVCGFLVLTASRFIPLVYFGALLSLSMLGGIFGDLILLPSLLRIFDRQPVSDAKLSQS